MCRSMISHEASPRQSSGIKFCEERNGTSEVWNFLEELREKGKTNKDARIQYEQSIFYIDLLARNGTRLLRKIAKYLEDDI